MSIRGVQMVVAAVAVTIGGVLLAGAAPEQMTIKVAIEEAGTAAVTVNGESHVVKLDDLADGGEQSFTAGEHTVVVRRAGDELKVHLDGRELGSETSDVSAHSMVWVGEGADGGVHVVGSGDHEKRIMVFTGTESAGDEQTTRIVRIGGDLPGDGEAVTVDVATIAKALGGEAVVVGGGADRVHYRCEADDSELGLRPADATQESYLCPVCGRPMTKAAAPRVKVIRIETEVEDDATK
jgi:hypothetical protein